MYFCKNKINSFRTFVLAFDSFAKIKSTVEFFQASFMYCEAAFVAQPRKWFSSILRMDTMGLKEWGRYIFKVGRLGTVGLLGVRRHDTDSLDQLAEFWAPRDMLLVIDNVITY